MQDERKKLDNRDIESLIKKVNSEKGHREKENSNNNRKETGQERKKGYREKENWNNK